MKKGWLITLMIWSATLIMTNQAQGQDQSFGPLSNEPANSFFTQLAKTFEVDIFYQEKWFENQGLSFTKKATQPATVLSEVLTPLGFDYFDNGRQQFFILPAGTEIGAFQLKQQENLSSDDTGQTGAFDAHNYQKAIISLVIGQSNPSPVGKKVYLNGRITDINNGEPVIGATVVELESNTGAISNADGTFSLPLVAGSSYTIQASSMGMDDQKYQITVMGPGFVNLELKKRLYDVKEVVVKSTQNHNVRGVQMGFQKIGMKEVKSIPTVMGERDIIKVATLVPGVQTVGEGSSGFNVRGSATDQNLFLLNDIPILNTGHLFGFFSAFNPDMVSDFTLYKSNFPGEYGGRLASVFDINTRKGNKKQFGARGSISPVTASALIETPIQKDRSSAIFSVRSTYSDWILDRLEDAEIAGRQAAFQDLMGGLHFLGKNNSSTHVFGYYSKDRFSLSTTNQYEYSNIGASVQHNRPLFGSWNLSSSGIFSQYNNYQANTVLDSRGFDHEFQVRSQEIKAKVSGYPWVGHKLSFGANAILHQLNQGLLQPFGPASILSPIDFGEEQGLEYGAFVADELSLTDHLTLYSALRYSYFGYLSEEKTSYHGPEPRVGLNYTFTPNFSIKASYNRMRQYLFMLSNTAAMSPTDRWKLVDNHIIPPMADQMSLGFYKNFKNSSYETSAEFYYKLGQNVIEYRDGVNLTFDPAIEALVLQGDQEAYGAEFFIKKNTGRLKGWLSYTYSRSFIQIQSDNPMQQINDGLAFPANYDKPHAFNVVGSYHFSRRISLSSNVVYSSGRPITYPTGYLVINGTPVVNYSLRNEFRVPDYFRVDLSLNFEGNLLRNKLAHGSWSFSVYNLTGRRNAYSVYFTTDRGAIKGYKLSIYGEPIFTLSYQFKLGNYAVD